MACNCEISVMYALAGAPATSNTLVRVGPVTLTPGPAINGHTSYTFDDDFYGILTWQYEDSIWAIVDDTDTVVAYLPDSSELECPGNSGQYGGTDWNIISVLNGGIFAYMTSYVCTPAPVCAAWYSEDNEVPNYLFPYSMFLLYVDIDFSQLYIGQPVTYLQHTNSLTVSGTGQYFIASILYEYNSQIFTTYTPGAEAIAIILKDSSDVTIWPGVSNGGYICFQPKNYTTTDETNKECFDKLVWEKQCEFSQEVLSYLNKIQYGDFTCCDDLDNLKNQRRALEILNCYDTRDIANNTTDYNNFTYNQIKKLLNT